MANERYAIESFVFMRWFCTLNGYVTLTSLQFSSQFPDLQNENTVINLIELS